MELMVHPTIDKTIACNNRHIIHQSKHFKVMKKTDCDPLWARIKKTLRIMKLTTFLLLVFCVHASASSFGQTEVSLEMKSSLGEVIEQLEKITEYKFVIKSDEPILEKQIEVTFHNDGMDEVLNKLLKGTNYQYKIIDHYIAVSPKGEGFMQQQKSVSGKVTDTNGESIPGVSVVVKGTTIGTVTNIDGEYIIFVPVDAQTIVFSFVGMSAQEINLNGQTLFNIVLIEDAIGLEEVVAIGYGIKKKVNITGSVESIGDKDLKNRPVTNVSQALTGQMAGVTIIQRSGQPGSDAGSIRIRGEGTFSGAGVEPLVLVDGLPSIMSDIDPNDIESISVLKDAASCSIYGSRAANGVILISTKRGKEGETKVSYNGYVGWQKPTEFPDYLDSWEYAKLYKASA